MREEPIVAALPEAFLRRMKELLGEEYPAFVESYEAKRVQGLRLNTRKKESLKLYQQIGEGFGLRPVPWCREGFYYQPDTRPGRHPFHEAGVYYIQEPSAMAVVSLLDPQPGEKVLDLCGAPGGKTTHIADRLQGQGLLVSNEIHPARAKILSRNVERMGIRNAVVTNAESGQLADAFPEFFHRIVVDAPCSGEGMFRKDGEARTQWSEENVRLCGERQQEILDNAARLLMPGGQMVYSTCTFSPEEDEEQIGGFLERHPEFSLVRVPEDRRLPGLSPGIPPEGRYRHLALEDTFRIWPHKAEGEGHYLALLEKRGEERAQEKGEQKGRIGKEGTAKERTGGAGFWNDRTKRQLLEAFLEETFVCGTRIFTEQEKGRLLLFGEQVYLPPESLPELKGLRVLRPGLHVGTLKKNRLEPSHALALSLDPEQVKRRLCLAPEGTEVTEYLEGKTLETAKEEKGWMLICVGEYPLGWGKAAKGVVKNHYPKGLRIPESC